MAILDKIKLSGTTYDIVDSTAIHSLEGYYTSDETNAAITAATSALAESIAEQGYQTSGDVQNAISGKADTTAVTQAISEATSGKLDTSVFSTYSGNVANELATKFAGAVYDSTSKHINFYDNASNTGTPLTYVDATAFIKDGMVDNVEIRDIPSIPAPTVAANNVKATWADDYNQTYPTNYEGIIGDENHGYTDYTKLEFGNMTSGTNYNFLVSADSCYQLTSASFVNDVYLNQDNVFVSAINLQGIYFYAQSPSGFTLPSDASAFLKEVYDGCETYETTAATYPIYVANLAAYSGATLYNDGNDDITWSQHFGDRLQEMASTKALVITFNTDAGKEDIIIPLTDIFDPSNYYNKSQVDAIVSGLTARMSEDEEVTAAALNNLNSSLSGKASQSDLTTLSGTVATKQDLLVSGTNIKTINNTSILGSGDITIEGGNKVEVTGTTLVFL